MPQTFSAEARVVIPYTVTTIPHEFRMYVRRVSTGGVATQIRDRNGSSNEWDDVIPSLVAALSHLATADWTFGTQRLERLVTGMWQTIATATAAGTHAGGSTVLASQATLTFRDQTYDPMKFVALEANQLPPAHIGSLTAGNAAMDAFLAEFTSAAAEDVPPWMVAVSRSNDYLASGGFVSGNLTYNRQLARRRGLA